MIRPGGKPRHLPGAGGPVVRVLQVLVDVPQDRSVDVPVVIGEPAHVHLDDPHRGVVQVSFQPGQLVPQVQLDDLPLAGGETAQRRPHDLAEFGLFQIRSEIVRPVGHPGGLVERGRASRRPQTAAALVPGHRVQPGAEPLLIAERGKLSRGDDERVLDGVGRVGGFREQRPAIGVQARRVAVVGGFQSRRVAGHDGGHDLAVEHAITLELIRAGLGRFRGIAPAAPKSPDDGALRRPGMIRARPPQGRRPAVRKRSRRAGPGRRAPPRRGRPGSVRPPGAVRPPGGHGREVRPPGASRPAPPGQPPPIPPCPREPCPCPASNRPGSVRAPAAGHLLSPRRAR